MEAVADEPAERLELSFLKDPKTRVGMWTIIKDSAGKDMGSMSFPVYFNDPTSLTQKMA